MNENYISEINVIYDINKEEINLFGSEFVKNNKNKCKIKIEEKEYELMEELNIKNEERIEIKLI